MTFLIDTHFVLWAALRPERIEPWAKALMVNPENTVLVSVASLYEIGIKVRNGKLSEAIAFERDLPANIRSMGYDLADLTARVTMRAARFSAAHADPFDRIIAAQAIDLDVSLLSADPAMDQFAVRSMVGGDR